MVVQVHTAGRPAVPRRALLTSIVLLSLVGALAAGMSHLRSRQPLGRRITPPGWQISFRSPRRLRSEPFQGPAGLDVRRFVGVTRRGEGAVLALMQIDGVYRDGEAQVVALNASELLGIRARGADWFPASFGSVEGVETLGSHGAAVVRTAIVDSGVVYVAILNTPNRVVDEDAYRLFDLTCRSVKATER